MERIDTVDRYAAGFSPSVIDEKTKFPLRFPDARIENHGSLVLVRPLSDNARDWLRDNIGDEAQYFGRALVVEPRYVAPLVEGMTADGLVIA